MNEYQAHFDQIVKHAKDCVSDKELKLKLKKSLSSKKPLVVKAGFDPTYPDLHLGHLVLLRKLKIFQDFGHQVCFLIGDFTARIGDPSGLSETRPRLSEKQIQQNTKTYAEQVFKVLNAKKTKILFNSSWCNKLKAQDWIQLCSHYTAARMLERDDFSKRFKQGQAIYIHEFLYPLIQGYDSYAMTADIELGGTDQIFNLLMGREIQKAHQQELQCVLTFPLLEGTDGKKKMSKSFNNFIALKDSPQEMYGKVMSLSDDLMLRYYELLMDASDVVSAQKEPLKYKKRLAYLLVEEFHSSEQARLAQEEFERVFSKNKIPEQIKEVSISAEKEAVWIAHLLKNLGMVPSTGEARRLIQGGGVQINSEKVLDVDLKLKLKSNSEYLLQVGKRKFLKVKVN
ncbi:MAG: tyrosine--tRNA ligase [Bdellovibrionales bacterium]|nr:tyrosine--tRNA ligase [Bdellovibrionales bacterium]